MRKLGSQSIETLKEAGYEVVEFLPDNEVILQEIDSDKKELWALNNNFAGYVLEIPSIGKFEFVRTLKN